MTPKIKKIYKAKSGSPFKQKDAQRIGEELEIIKKKESLTPQSIVNNSKNKNCFLYKYFEWDNNKAGEKWRLEQASRITRNLIEIVVINGKQIEEKAFFNVVGIEEKKQIYVSLTEAITTPSYRKQLLNQMKNHLQNVIRLIDILSNVDN